MKRGIAFGIALVVVVTVLAGALQAWRVHEKFGEWGLVAPEIPARIDALGRQYDRGDRTNSTSVPKDFKAEGETDGGATILAPPDASPQPVVIYVRDGEDQFWEYALVGGP